MKVILLHGKDTNPSQKWYPWLVSGLEQQDIDVHAPFLPEAENPVLVAWLREIDNYSPDEKTILIGHSRGGMAILRWLEEQDEKLMVKKVILVATNSGHLKEKLKTESNHGFYTFQGYDFEEIKKHCNDFVVMHSADDPWVPFSAGEENARELNAKFIKFDNYAHFGMTDRGMTKEIPELLEEVLDVKNN